MVRFISLLSLLLLPLIWGCAASPFQVPHHQFHSKVKTIALAPLLLPDQLDYPARVSTTFESLIEAALREAGFSVIPSWQTRAVWSRLEAEEGDNWQPVSVKQQEILSGKILTEAGEELQRQLHADAILWPSITLEYVGVSKTVSAWDHHAEKVGSYFWCDCFEGHFPALSLSVRVIGLPDGVLLYETRSGLRLLERLDQSSAIDKFVPVPRGDLFTDEKRNLKTITRALDPIGKKIFYLRLLN